MIFTRDSLSNVVCNLRTPQGIKEEVGTAIFIEKNKEPYLLTASHVIKNANAQTYAIISDQNGTPTKVSLNILIGGTNFVHHPQADLAFAKIAMNDANMSHLKNRCFPYSQIDTTQAAVSKDVELTTIGFPLGLGATRVKFSPLTYRTFAAAPQITLQRFDNQIHCDFIILELPSIGGYSGGPVFDLGYMISGMMTQTKEKQFCMGLYMERYQIQLAESWLQ